MTIELVRIGNSRGIRIPKPIIEECGLGETVEIRVENRRLVIAPHRKAREGWDKAFRNAASDKDRLLLEPLTDRFDRDEWQW